MRRKCSHEAEVGCKGNCSWLQTLTVVECVWNWTLLRLSNLQTQNTGDGFTCFQSEHHLGQLFLNLVVVMPSICAKNPLSTKAEHQNSSQSSLLIECLYTHGRSRKCKITQRENNHAIYHIGARIVETPSYRFLHLLHEIMSKHWYPTILERLASSNDFCQPRWQSWARCGRPC